MQEKRKSIDDENAGAITEFSKFKAAAMSLFYEIKGNVFKMNEKIGIFNK